MKVGRRRVLAAVGAVGAGFGLGLVIDRPKANVPAETPRQVETPTLVTAATVAPIATPSASTPLIEPSATLSVPTHAAEPSTTAAARLALLPTRTAVPAPTAAT